MSLNIMSQRENGFRGFGSEPGSILRLEGAMFRQPSTAFILRLVAIGRGIVSLTRITAFCTVAGVWVSSSGFTRHYTEFGVEGTVQKGNFTWVAVS